MYDVIDERTDESVRRDLPKFEAESACYSLNDQGLINRYFVRRSRRPQRAYHGPRIVYLDIRSW